jgi:hypothetical protein
MAVIVPLSAGAQAAPPAGMTAVETARSKSCVGEIAKVAELNAKATPYLNRAQRIRALAAAVALEDTTQAAPFDTLNALERDVHDWFVRDHALALRIVAGESSLVAKRDTARAVIEGRLQSAMDSVSAEAKARLVGADSVQVAAQPCQSAIFVRPAVLEACKTVSGSPLCAAARTKPDTLVSDTARFRFVNAANDLWDIQQMEPWSDPVPLQAGPNGSLVGARTMARARRGNIIVAVALAPLFRERAKLDSAQVAQYTANLDSLGFTFDHPKYVMAPALELQASVPPPIGGENLYLLHFGTVSKPDIVWSIKADKGGLLQATFPATSKLLDRLKAGDALSFTALEVPAGSTEGTPVYSIRLLNVNEARAATQLLGYMQSGDMSKDLNRLVPGGGGASGSGS